MRARRHSSRDTTAHAPVSRVNCDCCPTTKLNMAAKITVSVKKSDEKCGLVSRGYLDGSRKSVRLTLECFKPTVEKGLSITFLVLLRGVCKVIKLFQC